MPKVYNDFDRNAPATFGQAAKQGSQSRITALLQQFSTPEGMVSFMPAAGASRVSALKASRYMQGTAAPLAKEAVKNLKKLGLEKEIKYIPKFDQIRGQDIARNAGMIAGDIYRGTRQLVSKKPQTSPQRTFREVLRRPEGQVGGGQFQGSRIIRK